MKTLLDLVIYILRNYPDVAQLSKPRLVKVIYLIDWKNCIETGHQITPIKWYFNHYGPYVDDVIDMIRSHPDYFNLKSSATSFNTFSDKFSLKEELNYDVNIDEANKKIVDFVIAKTKSLGWNDFISLVYDTFPVRINSQYSFLDLEKDSQLYKAQKA